MMRDLFACLKEIQTGTLHATYFNFQEIKYFLMSASTAAIDPPIYECLSLQCRYITNSHKSYKLHLQQCREFLEDQKAVEERLRRKRTHDTTQMAEPDPTTQNSSVSNPRPTNRQRFEELAALFSSINDSTSCTSHQGLMNEPVTSPPEVTVLALDSLPEPLCAQSAAPVQSPAYRPTFGRYRTAHDALPEAPLAPLPDDSQGANDNTDHTHQDFCSSPSRTGIRRVLLRFQPRPQSYTTPVDTFGQFRVYARKPLTIPDSAYELSNVFDQPSSLVNDDTTHGAVEQRSMASILYPCPNISTFRLAYWHWCHGSSKSKSSRESLVRDVLAQPDFVLSDVTSVNWGSLDHTLATGSRSESELGTQQPQGWKYHPISLLIPPRTPTAAKTYASDPNINTYTIPNVPFRSLTEVVRDSFANNSVPHFVYEPYEAYYKDPITSQTHQSFGEAYESQRMRNMHEAVQDLILDEPCKLPRCVAALMAFSDATKLASFGPAKAWPIRVTLGNWSKYERCKPSSGAHYDVGFIPWLPADIQDRIRSLEPGKPVPKALLTQLRRELIHAVWALLLDNEFLRAWRQGIVVKCADGIERRVFPRIFSYSADYLEKILLATIRGIKSLYPCPRCLTPKTHFHELGLLVDQERRQLKRVDNDDRNDLVQQARSLIYDEGRAVSSCGVEDLLKSQSYTPTDNAFSRHLRLLGFDIFESLTVDLMHEFELGVWKSVFLHIIRILEATGSKAVADFNSRFRLIPAFGNGTIRKFGEDVTNLTQPTARNYEDILQCIIPAIEGLLPATYERQILDLLFILAHWHSLAKLRRHTSQTTTALRRVTNRLGHELRLFQSYTSGTKVYESNRELSARQRRADANASTTANGQTHDTPPTPRPALTRRQMFFTLSTSKVHAIGDYPDMIETFGTTDSVSTQSGELLHRRIKRRYARTNQRDFLPQMNTIEQIETRLNEIDSELKATSTAASSLEPGAENNKTHEDGKDDEETTTQDSGQAPYQIATTQKHPIILSTWVHLQRSDPAFKGFTLRLKTHLVARILGERYQEEQAHSDSALAGLRIQHDRIYSHQTLKLNYTSYDVRRAQDFINPCTSKRFVIVPAYEDLDGNEDTSLHQFWYAKVLGIYHANVSYRDRDNEKRLQRMDFLWVRWLGRVLDSPGSWDTCQLDQVGYFADSDNAHAFEFVDPADVIRAAHLIPRFASGRTNEFISSNPKSSMAIDDPTLGDWECYYVNRFADRDMFMRYFGMAIGHTAPTSTGVWTGSDIPEYEYTDMEDETTTGNPSGIHTASSQGASGAEPMSNETPECNGEYNSEEDDDEEDEIDLDDIDDIDGYYRWHTNTAAEDGDESEE